MKMRKLATNCDFFSGLRARAFVRHRIHYSVYGNDCLCTYLWNISAKPCQWRSFSNFRFHCQFVEKIWSDVFVMVNAVGCCLRHALFRWFIFNAQLQRLTKRGIMPPPPPAGCLFSRLEITRQMHGVIESFSVLIQYFLGYRSVISASHSPADGKSYAKL